MPLWPQLASPTGAKEGEEHGRSRRYSQGDAPPSGSLALGYHRSRFQRSNANRMMVCGWAIKNAAGTTDINGSYETCCRNRSAIDIGCTNCPLAGAVRLDVLANVAPSRRNSKLLPHPWLRRPPGASPGVMHGTALRAELGRSDDLLCPIRVENLHHLISMFLRRRRLTMLNPRL